MVYIIITSFREMFFVKHVDILLGIHLVTLVLRGAGFPCQGEPISMCMLKALKS